MRYTETFLSRVDSSWVEIWALLTGRSSSWPWDGPIVSTAPAGFWPLRPWRGGRHNDQIWFPPPFLLSEHSLWHEVSPKQSLWILSKIFLASFSFWSTVGKTTVSWRKLKVCMYAFFALCWKKSFLFIRQGEITVVSDIHLAETRWSVTALPLSVL